MSIEIENKITMDSIYVSKENSQLLTEKFEMAVREIEYSDGSLRMSRNKMRLLSYRHFGIAPYFFDALIKQIEESPLFDDGVDPNDYLFKFKYKDAIDDLRNGMYILNKYYINFLGELTPIRSRSPQIQETGVASFVQTTFECYKALDAASRKFIGNLDPDCL